MEPVRVGVLTISDRCFAGEAEDKNGLFVETFIKSGSLGNEFKIWQRECVPDELSMIKNKLTQWCDKCELDVILTIGGTGVADRDVTPEATKSVIEREVPGVAAAILFKSVEVTPMAMLSRLVCGIRNKTLIVNFPGSLNACRDCLSVIRPVVKHAVDLLKNRKDDINNVHTMLQRRSKVNTELVAKRNRESSYPLISAEKAQQIVLNGVKPLMNLQIDSKNALGYSLFADIIAPENLPSTSSSTKDGYAVIAADGAGLRLVVDTVVAGDAFVGSKLEEGRCVRVTTGAPVPEGADAIVQVEDTKLVMCSDDGRTELEIEILKAPKVGQDIRPVGSDIEVGSVLVKRGRPLTPFDLALLASAGINNVTAVKKPVIAVLSTGNELQNPEEKLLPGQIRDSNKIMLMKLLEKNGFSAVDCGIAIDEPDDILFKVNHALSTADVLICTGGVSMGEKDLLTEVFLQDLNAILHFGRIRMKPGKPTKFFSVPTAKETKFIFGLPGNPVSAAVTFHLFVLPALRRMSDSEPVLPKLLKVKIDEEIRLDDRTEFARASLRWDDDGVAHAEFTGNQNSSRLLSLVDSECLLHLPVAEESKKILPAGTIVNAQFV